MSNNRGWFWTPERLEKLRRILDAAAKRDEQGFHLGGLSLRAHVFYQGSRYGLEVDMNLAAKGLAILTFLEVLGPGLRGTKGPDYKRRYHPDKPRTTEADIQRYRRSKGVKSDLPPAR